MDTSTPHPLLEALWSTLGGDAAALDSVTAHGDRHLLDAAFDVDALATDSVTAATLAVAEFAATRHQRPLPLVSVDRRQAVAAFNAERLTRPLGWELPPAWDPLAGDYASADGWIRLHTNYASHRAAALAALGLGRTSSRAEIASIVAESNGADVESAVVAAGGCAAVMYSDDEWARHPARVDEPVATINRVASTTALRPVDGSGAPLAGVRVLDLTRVMAGPVASRFLAAHGAEVIRIDPPGFEEVPVLVAEFTAGKRCVALDLREPANRRTFELLVAEADVVLSGLRPGALDGLGYSAAELRAINPSCVDVRLCAYGWSGPWAQRRGFDSLVQMSTGIAAVRATADGPTPLPCQALDHATGFIVAAATARALTRRLVDNEVTEVRASLAATAGLLRSLPTAAEPAGTASPATTDWVNDDTAVVDTAWGPMRRAPIPGQLDGVAAVLPADRPAGPLLSAAPAW